jgi:hypothetical protein
VRLTTAGGQEVEVTIEASNKSVYAGANKNRRLHTKLLLLPCVNYITIRELLGYRSSPLTAINAVAT